MSRIIFSGIYFATLLVFCECSSKQEEMPKDFKDLVRESFNRYNEGALNEYDSCFFVNTLKQDDFKYADASLMRIIYDVEILSYTIPSIDFSFSVMKRKGEVNWLFFGAFENYMLSHSKRIDSAKLVTVKNENLNTVVNKFFASTSMSTDSLKVFLHELYYENDHGLYRPIFDEDVRITNLGEYLTEDQIDLLGKDDNLIAFKDSELGLTIFKWAVVDGKIEITGFIYPFGKYKFIGYLDVPPVFRDCDSLD